MVPIDIRYFGSEICKLFSDKWFILSAKYGLIEPENKISPYDIKIDDLKDEAKNKWVKEVSKKLKLIIDKDQPIVFLGDSKYFEDISIILRKTNITTFIPFKHISHNHRVDWLSQNLNGSLRNNHLKRLYDLLFQADFKGNFQFKFSDFQKEKKLPKKGIYIFTRKETAQANHVYRNG